MLKFACIPAKYAPKKKLVNFALPKWRQKIAEFESNPDIQSWINNLYQDKVFQTRSEFNRAYDSNNEINWNHKPMVLTDEDICNFETEFNEGGFGEFTKAESLIKRMRDVQKVEKIVFVY